jgi:hypothetical protein
MLPTTLRPRSTRKRVSHISRQIITSSKKRATTQNVETNDEGETRQKLINYLLKSVQLDSNFGSCQGLNRFDVDSRHLSTLKKFVCRAQEHCRAAPWNGSSSDTRLRSYFFPPQEGVQWQLRFTAPFYLASLLPADGQQRLDSAGVKMHMREFNKRARALDEKRNREASVQMSTDLLWTQDLAAALQSIVDTVHPLVADRYQQYVCMGQLVALQPNLQNNNVSEPPCWRTRRDVRFTS